MFENQVKFTTADQRQSMFEGQVSVSVAHMINTDTGIVDSTQRGVRTCVQASGRLGNEEC